MIPQLDDPRAPELQVAVCARTQKIGHVEERVLENLRLHLLGSDNSALSAALPDIWGNDPTVAKRYAEFMAYIRSPIARQIREREIANWRREHEKHKAGFGEAQRKRGRPRLVREAEVEADADDDLEPGPPLSPPALPPLRPGQRFGKHKASRGNPFTQKKQKKKKKHRR